MPPKKRNYQPKKKELSQEQKEKQEHAAWVVEQKRLLIDLVRAEQIIYDRALPGHHDSEMIKAAWMRIAEALGLEEDDSKSHFILFF